MIAAAACTSVHQTEACIPTAYGKVVGPPLSPGLHYTGAGSGGVIWGISTSCFTLTDQNYPSDRESKETMTAQTRDPMTVEGDVAIVFAFDPKNITNVFLEKRTEAAAEVQIVNAIRTGYRDALAGWSVVEITSERRASLGDSVRVHIQRELGQLATIKNVFVRDIRVPKEIEAARIAATQQNLLLSKAKQQLAIDSMQARSQVITAQAQAEANRLTSQSYISNPKMLDLEIAKALAALCGKATTCVIGASPNSLLGIR